MLLRLESVWVRPPSCLCVPSMYDKRLDCHTKHSKLFLFLHCCCCCCSCRLELGRKNSKRSSCVDDKYACVYYTAARSRANEKKGKKHNIAIRIYAWLWAQFFARVFVWYDISHIYYMYSSLALSLVLVLPPHSLTYIYVYIPTLKRAALFHSPARITYRPERERASESEWEQTEGKK